MAIVPRDFNDMVSEGLNYLTANTEITYLAQGSIARALVDIPLLELARLQDFVITNYDNSFLSGASGAFLDLFGDGFGLPRLGERRSNVNAEDGTIRFYVRSGTLGQRLPDPRNPSKGLIPKGTTISNSTGSIQFETSQDVQFNTNLKSVYVPAVALNSGDASRIGANQLTSHSLSSTDVLVTNDNTITTGADGESDDDYRFRLSRAFSTRFSNNGAAVQVAASSVPGVLRSTLIPFLRGAGTFDVLLIPRGNKLPRSVKEEALRSVSRATAYGISPRIKEPEYVPVKLTVRLRYDQESGAGLRDAIRDNVQTAILNYIGNIPLGGELIINQLRAAILGTNAGVVDMTLLELCIDGHPQAIRNSKLEPDELFVPDDQREAVIVI